jgi:hypothetical protein
VVLGQYIMKIIRYSPATGERVEYDDGNPPPPLDHRCPCCRCKTLHERGGYEICPVCFWEDDGQDDYDADIVRGGPNPTSLTEARHNFKEFGACDLAMVGNVRVPTEDEKGSD